MEPQFTIPQARRFLVRKSEQAATQALTMMVRVHGDIFQQQKIIPGYQNQHAGDPFTCT
jgi:hypothetical protein